MDATADTLPWVFSITPAEGGRFLVSLDGLDGPFVFAADIGALREIRNTIDRALGDGFARTRKGG